jgi:hypothetical protein
MACISVPSCAGFSGFAAFYSKFSLGLCASPHNPEREVVDLQELTHFRYMAPMRVPKLGVEALHESVGQEVVTAPASRSAWKPVERGTAKLTERPPLGASPQNSIFGVKKQSQAGHGDWPDNQGRI